jgi:hypothetical protein
MMPNEYTSILGPYFLVRSISGAMYRGVPIPVLCRALNHVSECSCSGNGQAAVPTDIIPLLQCLYYDVIHRNRQSSTVVTNQSAHTTHTTQHTIQHENEALRDCRETNRVLRLPAYQNIAWFQIATIQRHRGIENC